MIEHELCTEILKKIREDLPEFTMNHEAAEPSYLILDVRGYKLGSQDIKKIALVHIFVIEENSKKAPSIMCRGLTFHCKGDPATLGGRAIRSDEHAEIPLADPEVFEKIVKYAKDNQLDSIRSLVKKVRISLNQWRMVEKCE